MPYPRRLETVGIVNTDMQCSLADLEIMDTRSNVAVPVLPIVVTFRRRSFFCPAYAVIHIDLAML